MNYDFLQNYNIPVKEQTANNQYADANYSTMQGAYGTYSMQSTSTESTPAVNTAYYGYGNSNTYNSYQAQAGSSNEYYQNPERFIPPSKHGAGYKPQKSFKRKNNGAGGGGSAAKREFPMVEVTADGKFVMFLGRDESYPDELNSLIHPLSCDLCNVKMNSQVIAKDHYESKAHDKHLNSWLFNNYNEKGLSPPSIKRFVKQGVTGPDAYYCESCDLKLTSLTHANQHYAGRKHGLVISQKAKPSGVGFYNSEGKWVRTGTKLTPNATKDNRYQIGDTFILTEIMQTHAASSADTKTVSSVADTTTTIGSEVKLSSADPTKNLILDPALFCSVCKVSATSQTQMAMHLGGSKHMKKLKSAGLNPASTEQNDVKPQSDVAPPSTTAVDNVLLSAIKEETNPNPTDLSMYRTPSGQYYCKICNTSIAHLTILEQHLQGKRHLKRQTEERAITFNANKKN